MIFQFIYFIQVNTTTLAKVFAFLLLALFLSQKTHELLDSSFISYFELNIDEMIVFMNDKVSDLQWDIRFENIINFPKMK